MKTIYYNGVIYTGEMPFQKAFIEENGRFLYVGDNKTAISMKNEGDRLIDLQGKFVCSGFNDSHMHLVGFGKVLNEAILSKHTNNLKEMLEYLKEFATRYKQREWIIGRGWNQDYFSDVDRMPNRYDLDQISLDRPVCIVRACGHALVVNSKALSLLNINKDILQPDGGKIGLENDEPDGRFYDNAMDLIYDKIPIPDKNELKDMILHACKELNSYGITSCQSDDYCTYRNLSWEVIHKAYRELEMEGKLTIRVYEQCNLTNLNELKKFIEAGNMTGKGNEYFKIGPFKMLGDGALGARTAFLSIPYADDSSTYGIPVFTQKTFHEMIEYAHKQGMQIAVHAIGDACLDWLLEAYEMALKTHSRENHRHGIVHCQITRADQLKKIKQLNLHVYAQTIFLDYDINIVEKRVGKELASTSYHWKYLMNQGVSVSNGSDCPVELPNVMSGIQCAVTRKSLKDSDLNKKAYLPNESFTIQEALDSYTKKGAYSSFEEHLKGKIEKKMLSDFVILNQNPFEAELEKLKDISVEATYLGGKKVYERTKSQ